MRAHFNFSVLAALALACEPGLRDTNRGDDGLVREGARVGCLERTTDIDLAKNSPLVREARELLQGVAGDHAADLRWQDGTATRAKLRVLDARARHVESREDPQFKLDRGRECVDRLRMEVDFTLASDDGRLRESFNRVAFEPREDGALAAWFQRKRERLAGDYVRQSPGALGVLTDVYFELALAPAVFEGDISEETTTHDGAALGPAVAWFRPPSAVADGDASSSTDASLRGPEDAGAAPASDGAPEVRDSAIGDSGASGTDREAASLSVDASGADASARADASVRDDASARDGGAAPLGCYGDQDCKASPGTRCSAATECLPPPGCGPGRICPAVCYGHCK